MTETPDTPPAGAKKRGGGLASMLIADLRSMAAGMGIAAAGSMKKAQLVAEIKARQSGAPSGGQSGVQSGSQPGDRASTSTASTPREQQPARKRTQQPEKSQEPEKPAQQSPQKSTEKQTDKPTGKPSEAKSEAKKAGAKDDQHETRKRGGQQDRKPNQGGQSQGGQNQGGQHDQDAEDEDGNSRRNRRRRGRDRQTTRAGRNEPDTTILEDDVLVPAAGILDVLDNYAFVRTSGYLPGADDVYLSLSMVRKYSLRRGDALVGQVRQPREGERREKFNPMVRIDSVNGSDPDASRERPDFGSLTPVHPDQRLRLGRGADPIGRVIDIAAPIGKGQRGLLVTPPRTGTTTLLKSVATSITTNSPECHLMVVLVDARPEEVTDFQRVVKGEVVASTFDRQPTDHTLVAELAIERARRLVELGHDVVVLLDSITRLGRAYDLAAPAGGRVLASGVDASAIHPTKHFFGAARNIEDGGSLTILATALVETGSAADELFLEELLGTANLELRFSSERAALDLVPAVDPAASGTRHEDLLLAPAEGAVVGDLRRRLTQATTQAALEELVSGTG